jgi:hypothetical protein
MGSIARVNVNYVDLIPLFRTKITCFLYFMDGWIFTKLLCREKVIIMGRANGISEDLKSWLKQTLNSSFCDIQKTESLNVATATAIVVSLKGFKYIKNQFYVWNVKLIKMALDFDSIFPVHGLLGSLSRARQKVQNTSDRRENEIFRKISIPNPVRNW